MKCPYCEHHDSKVTDKRDSKHLIRRRRECLKCKKRYTTYEDVQKSDLFVVKKDGRREVFNRDKLLLGLIKACEKRDISHEIIEKNVNIIEDKVRKRGKSEIKSELIGKFTMDRLKKVDKVAYIRFASVYMDFQDVNDFKKGIKEVVI
ncbi:MAG: transcriptional regulator NrdR [Nanoarchaeota archaeon]|nr:transcriptional regulator NrdR [Nanoarchaeota archaeon]